jgi:AP endonuclease-2
MNPDGVFQDGQRLQAIPTKANLPFSARLLPEFNVGQRRNIKDMFKRQPSNAQTTTFVQNPHASQSMSPPKPADVATSFIVPSPTQTSTSSTLSAHSPSKAGPVKRKSPDTNGSKATKAKKVKQTPATTAPSAKAQGTLRAFFRSAAPVQPGANLVTSTEAAELDPAPEPTLSLNHVTSDLQLQSLTQDDIDGSENDMGGIYYQLESFNETLRPAADVVDPEDESDLTQAAEKRINSSEQWGMLMRKPKIPLCEDHEEPCTSFQTKKKGPNCGRMFYICARPLGPSGGKEKNTQWRCRTFIWASDWQGGTGSGS